MFTSLFVAAALTAAATPPIRLSVDQMSQLQIVADSIPSGSTVILPAGDYATCASWRADNITITADVAGLTRLRDVSCEGKGIFVVKGANTTISNLVFENATVPDQNGAGIRVEAPGLIVRHSTFNNNENGILAAIGIGGVITIDSSRFDGNGKCNPSCAHGIYISDIDKLIVSRSVFLNTHQGHHIKSRALTTVVESSVIDDGATGDSSYLVDLPNGGNLRLRNNTIIKGTNAANHSTMVTIGEEGATHPSQRILIDHNRFTNQLTVPTLLVRNSTSKPIEFRYNTIRGLFIGNGLQ